MLKRTGAGGPDSEVGYQFLGIHSSPILMEVALFFKSTLRKTERNGKQHHGMRPRSPGTRGEKGVGLSADRGQPARGAVSIGGAGPGAIRGAAARSARRCVLRAGSAGPGWVARHRGDSRRAVLWIREWRGAAGIGRGDVDRQCLGSECGVAGDVAGRGSAGGCGARVGPRRVGAPLGMRRIGCDRRQHGEFYRACRGPSRAAGAERLGRGERRRVRSAAADGSRRR